MAVLELLRRGGELFSDARCLQRVCLYYRLWGEPYNTMRDEGLVHTFVQGVPSYGDLVELATPHADDGGCVVIIDDAGGNGVNRTVADLFCRMRQQLNITSFLLTQSIFSRANPYLREISLSAKYFFLFRNHRDKTEVRSFANQFTPGDTGWFLSAFAELTALRPYSFFVLDMHELTPEDLRVRTDLFNDDGVMTVVQREESRRRRPRFES